MVLSGSCNFCRQVMAIDSEKYPLLDPEDQETINDIVTERCDCTQAKSERRKAETAKKLEDYINTEVAPEARDIIRAAVDAVRGFCVESITITDNDGWKTKMRIDKDGYLVFDPKKTISKTKKF